MFDLQNIRTAVIIKIKLHSINSVWIAIKALLVFQIPISFGNVDVINKRLVQIIIITSKIYIKM